MDPLTSIALSSASALGDSRFPKGNSTLLSLALTPKAFGSDRDPSSAPSTLRSAPVAISSKVPVDYFADPDGIWDYEALLDCANIDPAWGKVQIGALTRPFLEFPEGSAVITLASETHPRSILVDCTGRSAAA